MNQICNPDKCTGCGACANLCPQGAVTMEEDKEGFLRPAIDAERCVGCGLCENRCPVQRHPDGRGGQCKAFAAVAREEAVRGKSSSGGVFSVLANYVLEQGGVVFGAALSEDCKTVRHIAVESQAELEKVCTSKYVQSEIGTAYQLAKAYLENKRTVLFTGTPCQIAGLRSFLGRDCPNLVTQDVICHGIPSPLVWRNYLSEQEMCSHSQACAVNFRDKTYGWKNYGLGITFVNGKHMWFSQKKSTFLRGYLSNLFLRQSCHCCLFKGERFESDFTLGDFWGIRHVLPKWNDRQGVSLLLVRTPKAEQILEALAPKLVVQEIDAPEAIHYNQALLTAASKHPKRDSFLQQLETGNVSRLIAQFCPLSLKARIKLLVPEKLKYWLKAERKEHRKER